MGQSDKCLLNLSTGVHDSISTTSRADYGADGDHPAEVTIAITQGTPIHDRGIAANRPPKPHAGRYNYVTFDGGKTWTTVPTPNSKNLVQGDDVVAFSSNGITYHVHLSFDGIRVARPARDENGMIVKRLKRRW